MSLKSQAIQSALLGDWSSAINHNIALLEENPQDIETLNRLAFAYSILGKIKDAKETYKKVLSLDNKNPVAVKNLARLADTPSGNEKSVYNIAQASHMFIEEPGKTKVIDLVNLADKKIIVPLRIGDLLILSVKRSKIFLLDSHKQYVGMLPDDIAKRLIEFLNGGNTYEAYVKSAQVSKVTVFIKETKRADGFQNQPSFLTLNGKHKNEHTKSYRNEESSEESES